MSPPVGSVGLIAGNLDEDAFRNVALGLSAGFVAAGLDVDVAHLKGDAARFREALDPRVRLVKLRADRSLFSTRAVARYLREAAPDVVVTLGWIQNLPGAVAAKLARYDGRLVLTEHGHVSQEAGVEHGDKLLWRNIPRAVRRVYPWADALVAVDRGIVDDLRENVGVDLTGLEVEVIPNPVDVDRVRALAGRLPERDRPASSVVTVGRLSPQKNQRLLLEAFARLPRGLRLTIVGDGPLRADLEQLARSLGVSDAVTFTGHVTNPHALAAAADVFVLPSQVEGCPLALIEALAYGLPAIATDCAPGPRSILGDGEHGVLVPPDDVAALTEALHDLLGDAPRRRVLSERAERRAHDFTVEAITARWLAFFDRLVGRDDS